MKFLAALFLFLFVNFANAQVKLLTFNDLDKRISNGKDTTYLINFWATWCAPCVAELPHFEKLNAAYFKNPVKVILISMDFKSKLKSDVIPFAIKHELKVEVYLANEKEQQAFIEKVDKKWSGAIPATLIANRKSKLFFEKTFTYKELEDLVKKSITN